MDVDLTSKEQRREVESAVLCWLATAASDGTPNVSPKELWDIHDAKTLVIAEIASAGSVRNLKQNPSACVSFVDVFRQRGLKLVGNAQVISPTSGEFAEHAGPLLALAGDKFKVRNVIALTVERVTPIVAPSYTLYHATEDDMKADAYDTYRVMPVG